MNRKQREQNRATAAQLKLMIQPKFRCINCGELSHGHFVPPSFGEEGFYICKPLTPTKI